MPKDNYSQVAYIAVTESAPNTLTFNGVTLISNLLSQQGMVIHRVLYNISVATMEELAQTGDAYTYGLAGDDNLSSVIINQAEVYDFNRLVKLLTLTGDSALIENCTKVVDFTGLPGGGKLVPADRVYIFTMGTALVAATTIGCRIDFTIVDLGAADYLELAQSLRVLK